MDLAFVKVLNVSISASWLVLVVLVLRLLLKKSPRWIHVALWGLVAVRLLCPNFLESGMSLVPSTQTVPESVFYLEANQQQEQVSLEILEPRPNMPPVSVELEQTVNNVQTWEVQWSLLWPAGMLVMLLHALISYLRLRRKVSASMELSGDVYLCDYIDTPFILGVLRPRIYLPSGLASGAEYVLAHERAHIARKDHWWKPMGYLLLTVHWFNPLLWAAYILLCRDIELACDERVVKQMGLPERKTYSETLLSCSVSRRNLAACPLAFGEVGVKQRIKSVLNYQQPGFWMVVIAVVCLILAAVCFLTDPVQQMDAPFGRNYQVQQVIYQNPVLSYHMTEDDAPLFRVTEEGELEVRRVNQTWENLGTMEEIQITMENFDNCFFGESLGWEGEPSAKQLRWDTEQAWSIPYELEGQRRVYYLLKLTNGDIYLADGAGHTETVNFSWCFRLSDSGEGWVEEVTPFGSYYRVNGTVYADGTTLGDYLWETDLYALTAGHSMTQQRNLQFQAEHLTRFAPVELTRDNFANALEDRDLAQALMNENSGAWEGEYHGNLWYLLQQEGGQVYLAVSTTSGEEQRIHRIYRLHRVISDDPHTPSIDPLQWMLNIQYELGYPNPQVTVESQGHQVVLSDWEFSNLKTILQTINSEQMAVGTLKGEPEVTVHIQPAEEDGFPAELYWNQEEMVLLLDTGSWNIIDPELEEYLSGYAYTPRELSPLYAPGEAYFWCQNMSRKYLGSYCTADQMVQLDDYYMQPRSRNLLSGEIDELLSILREIPKSAFQKAEPVQSKKDILISCRDVWDENSAYGYVKLSLLEDGIYYTYCPNEGNPYQTWKLDSWELAVFMDNILSEDTSDWYAYAPTMITDGDITAQVGPVVVTIPQMVRFEYTGTGDNIRFHPKDSEHEDWVSITWQEEWEVQAGTTLHTTKGIIGGREALSAYFPNTDVWSSIRITLETGGYLVFHNESGQDWVKDCYSEIHHILINLEIAELAICG